MTSIVGLAGGVMSGIGSIYASEAKAQMMRSRAKAQEVAGKEAQEGAEFEAQFTEQQSTVRQDQIRRYGERLQAKAQAMAGAEGVDVGGGDVVLAAMDNAANIETDALRAKYNGDLRAGQLRWQGSIARDMADYNARVQRQEADITEVVGIIGGIAQTFSGAAVSYQSTPDTKPYTGPYGQAAADAGTATSNQGYGSSAPTNQQYTNTDSTGQSLIWD